MAIPSIRPSHAPRVQSSDHPDPENDVIAILTTRSRLDLGRDPGARREAGVRRQSGRGKRGRRGAEKTRRNRVARRKRGVGRLVSERERMRGLVQEDGRVMVSRKRGDLPGESQRVLRGPVLIK
jgi:hypothetical protein